MPFLVEACQTSKALEVLAEDDGGARMMRLRLRVSVGGGDEHASVYERFFAPGLFKRFVHD